MSLVFAEGRSLAEQQCLPLSSSLPPPWLGCGSWYGSLGMVVFGWRLDLMILGVFSNLSRSMIPWFYDCMIQQFCDSRSLWCVCVLFPVCCAQTLWAEVVSMTLDLPGVLLRGLTSRSCCPTLCGCIYTQPQPVLLTPGTDGVCCGSALGVSEPVLRADVSLHTVSYS